MNKKTTIKIVSIVIVVFTILFLLLGMRNSASKVAGKYLKARCECDVNLLVSLVPDEIIKNITDEYGCSRAELIEAVEKEIEYDKDYYQSCNVIKSSTENYTLDEYDYEDYIDRRVEDCMKVEKIKKMCNYTVDVNDNYYFKDIIVFQYGIGQRYYSLDATNFVAYAVWELY
ncbi:MAG: hypothetical protein ACI4WH_08550 [Oscillospiraceae bacterium]